MTGLLKCLREKFKNVKINIGDYAMGDLKKEQIKAIVISSVILVLGILFVSVKSEMIGILQTIACLVLLVYGILQIIVYCFLNTENKDYSKLIIGAVSTFLALLLIFVNVLFVIILGAFVGLSGVMFIKTAVEDKNAGDKQWWISLIVGILFLVLGISVAVLCNFDAIKNIVMIVFGVTLIVEGIMGFVFVLVLHKVIRLNFGKSENEETEDGGSLTENEDSDEEKVEEIKEEKSQKQIKNNQKNSKNEEKELEIEKKPQKVYRIIEEDIDPDDGGFI